MKNIFFILGCFFIAITDLAAQDQENKLSALDFLTGSWNVTAENRLSASGPWETSKARSVIIKTTGNKILEEDYSGALQSKPFAIKTVIAYDVFFKRFQRTSVDSEHGVLVDYNGQKKGDTVFFDKTWIYPNKTTVKLRTIYVYISANEFIIENMRMPQNTFTWDVTNRMKYNRSK